MKCQVVCGHKIDRFHWSCLFCRHRRWLKGELGPPHYHHVNVGVRLEETPAGAAIMSDCGSVYVLLIDGRRRHSFLKDKLLKKTLEMAEFLAN